MITVHISSCGSHAAILLSGSKILVKPYFKDGYAGRIPSGWSMFGIDLSPFDTNIDDEFDLSPFDTNIDDEFDLSPFNDMRFPPLAFDNGRIAIRMV